MNAPLYQGTQYTPAHATQASVSPQHPFADNFLKSAAAQTQQALDLEAAIRDRQEYTLEQNRSAALQAAHQALDNEMIQRLSLDDGAEDSFYDDNGILKKDEIESLRSRYLSVADAWTSGFTTEQGRAAATQAQQQYRSSVTNAINSKILAGLGNRARRALQNNIKACMARGDYDTPIKLARESNKEGYTSNANLAILEDDINTARWEYELAAATSPEILESAKRQLESSQFFQSSPTGKLIANKMLDKIDSMLTYQSKPRATEEETIISTTAATQKEQTQGSQNSQSTSGKSTGGIKIVPAQAPPASDGWVQRHFLLHGSNLKDFQAQKNALILLRKEAALHITDPEDVLQVGDIRILGNSLELSDTLITAVINERKKNLTAALPKFNVNTAITAIERRFDASKALRDFDIIKASEAEPDMAEAWKTTLKEHDINTKSILETARQDFETWFASNPSAHEVMQASVFQQILAKRMQENSLIAANPQHSWAHLHLDEFFNIYQSAGSNAAKTIALDQYSRKTLQEQLKKDTETYNLIKNSPQFIQDYYRGDYKGAVSRFFINQALAHQARTVRIESPLDNPSKAAALPDSSTQLIIYTNPDPEKTSAISRQDSILVQQGGDTFRVKIVETDAVSAPVPSTLLQQKLKLIGRKPNYFYFQNNILTFTQKKKTKSPVYQTQNYITPPSDMLYDENGAPSLYPANPDGTAYNPLDDGLAPSI